MTCAWMQPVAARLGFAFMVLVTSLSGCALDKEAELRQQLAGWVYLAQTRYFSSRMNCTAAVFDLALPVIRATIPRARSIDSAVERLKQGQVIVFDMPETSPHAVSEQLMSRDLVTGLGLLSTGVGPVKDCMEEHIANGYFAVLMSPETLTLYDPAGDALLMVYPPENLAVFLRGNV